MTLAAQTRNGAIIAADQPPRAYGRGASQLPPGFLGVVTLLTVGLVVAYLYFARDVIVPIALAVLLSFLLAPAVRLLRRLRFGRITAVGVTVLLAFMAIVGFATVVVEEVYSLAEQLPEYRFNLETKIRSLPWMVPGGGVFRRAPATLQELGKELTNADRQGTANSAPSALAAKPVPVQIEEPEPGPLQLVKTVVGPLLQPIAVGGLVVVFVILILLEREDLRDRLLRLAGRHDLHRTTEAMNDAAQRISRYLLSQLVVNISCGVPIGLGLAVIG